MSSNAGPQWTDSQLPRACHALGLCQCTRFTAMKTARDIGLELSHLDASRRVRVKRRRVLPYRLVQPAPSRPLQAQVLTSIVCGARSLQARSRHFPRELVNIPLTHLSPFHQHTHHCGVSAMEPLTPQDFYFAGPGVESPDRYRPGGYHPVHLGDVYYQRYRIIHKLGYGTYSTVWLARDLQRTTHT